MIPYKPPCSAILSEATRADSICSEESDVAPQIVRSRGCTTKDHRIICSVIPLTQVLLNTCDPRHSSVRITLSVPSLHVNTRERQQLDCALDHVSRYYNADRPMTPVGSYFTRMGRFPAMAESIVHVRAESLNKGIAPLTEL